MEWSPELTPVRPRSLAAPFGTPARLVSRVVVIEIDLRRTPLRDRTHKIETRVLVPPPALIEEDVGDEDRSEEREFRLAEKARTKHGWNLTYNQ